MQTAYQLFEQLAKVRLRRRLGLLNESALPPSDANQSSLSFDKQIVLCYPTPGDDLKGLPPMLQTIKKHPLGFLHSMSWVGAGATMLYSMRYESAGYPEALFAEAAVILFLVCCGVFLLTPLIGLIIKLVRKQRPSVTQECHFVSAAAKWYESTRSDFFWYYVIIVLVPILPIAALLLPAQEQYIACGFIITFGISICLCFVIT